MQSYFRPLCTWARFDDPLLVCYASTADLDLECLVLHEFVIDLGESQNNLDYSCIAVLVFVRLGHVRRALERVGLLRVSVLVRF